MPKTVLLPIKIMDAVSLGADAVSSVFKTQYLDDVSIQVNLTSTPTGAFSVQVSLDYSQNVDGSVRNAGTWNSLTLSSSTAIAAGSPASLFIDVMNTGAPYMRLNYTRTSGSGTATAYATGKSKS